MPQPIETESIPAIPNTSLAQWLDGPHIMPVEVPSAAVQYRIAFEALMPSTLEGALVAPPEPGTTTERDPWTAFLMAPDRARLIALLRALADGLEQQP